MSFKTGDVVKFTKACIYKGFHESGVTGVVKVFPTGHWPYEVHISQEDHKKLVELGFIATTNDVWPCSAEEIELVLPPTQE